MKRKIKLRPISPKEQEVLRLLAQCTSYSNISKKLGIGIGTLYNHIYRLMVKTGTHRKEELIKYAQEHSSGVLAEVLVS